ncbi:MAG: tRNA pseudouridine(55) synthase TruB [Cyclobacteriaceae bacterium]|nr:tRNA pseudouridine(55) synthase TruB [Cyclobacteriaceae bacterium HetDA_MAG_MS6]
MTTAVDNKYEAGQLLLIDKPLTWTSFDVVKKLRYALKVKKIGHAGTLDPLASGLLLIGTGKFTKKLSELQGLDKSYSGVIEIGRTTPSYDLETDFDSEHNYDNISPSKVQEVVDQLTGVIIQYPPAHSAVKVNGQRAYKKARKNESVELKSREVTIYTFEVSKMDLPEIQFHIHCSKGTYIRSIAHDLGRLLGVGAYLKALRRTSIGDYLIQDAHSLEDFLKSETIHGDH